MSEPNLLGTVTKDGIDYKVYLDDEGRPCRGVAADGTVLGQEAIEAVIAYAATDAVNKAVSRLKSIKSRNELLSAALKDVMGETGFQTWDIINRLWFLREQMLPDQGTPERIDYETREEVAMSQLIDQQVKAFGPRLRTPGR